MYSLHVYSTDKNFCPIERVCYSSCSFQPSFAAEEAIFSVHPNGAQMLLLQKLAAHTTDATTAAAAGISGAATFEA